MSFQSVTPQTFINFNNQDGINFLKQIRNIEISEFSINIDDNLINQILTFINSNNYNLNILIDNYHSFLWNKDIKNDKDKIEVIKKIINPESYRDIKSFNSLSDYFYQVSLHLMGDTCGGLEIYKHPDSTINISNMDFLRQNKINFIQREISTRISKENSFLFAPEFDFKDFKLEDENIKCLILDPTIHKGNNGKALFYHKNLHVLEFSKEIITRMLFENYSKNILSSYEKFSKHFALVMINNITVILVHLKSIGSVKDLEKNKELYTFICKVKNMFQDSPTIMMGDFNLPLPSEENGHLGYQSNHLENYQLQDDEKWYHWIYRSIKNLIFEDTTDYMNKGFIRAGYDPKQVIGKSRSDNGYFNSQAYKSKFYEDRQYNTDQIFFNFPCESKTILSPQRSSVPIIPYIGKNNDGSDSHLSDHQILQSTFQFEGIEYNASVFNVLANCCSGPPPLKDNISGIECKTIEIEYSVLMYNIFNAISFV